MILCPHCPTCRKYPCKPDDIFCGLCGAPLCRLVWENAAQVDLEGSSGKVIRNLAVSNDGIVPIRLELTTPRNGAVRTVDRYPVTIWPKAAAVPLTFQVDTDNPAFEQSPACEVQFRSSAPLQATGKVFFCLPATGPVTLSRAELNLGDILQSEPGQASHFEYPFSLFLTNEGSRAVRIGIGPRGDDPNLSPIQVGLQNLSEFWLNGHQSNVELKLLAWSCASPRSMDDTFALTLDHSNGKKTELRIDLKARVVAPPKPDWAPVDFGQMVPGQILTHLLPIRNQGGGSFNLLALDLKNNPFLRSWTSLPLSVDAGAAGRTIELVFSTRFAKDEAPTRNSVKGHILVMTDLPRRTQFRIPWKADLIVLEPSQGTLALDFGTINSCAAYLPDHAKSPQIIHGHGWESDDKKANGVIPSLLVFLPDQTFVAGKAALEKAPLHPEGVVYSVKRSIEQKEISIYGTKYSSIQLASLTIEQLLLEAMRRHRARPKKIAMSVPAAFWGPKREGMLEACRQACHRAWSHAVPIAVVDEPTAVAINFLHSNPSLFETMTPGCPKHILVFDFGGGTLDISIVQLRKTVQSGAEIEPIIARGDNFMGGIDIDRELLRWLAAKAKEKEPRFADTPIALGKMEFYKLRDQLTHFGSFQRARCLWYERAKEAKEALSESDSTAFSIEYLLDKDAKELNSSAGRVQLQQQITRAAFGDIIEQRVQRATRLVQDAVKLCRLEHTDIELVLLTGQSCRIHKVREAVTAMFPHARVPTEKECPLKESVACGAAIAAELQHGGLGTGGALKVLNLNRTSYRYGLRATEGFGWRFIELIPAGKTFAESRGSYEFESRPTGSGGWQEIVILQNGSQRDSFGQGNRDVDVVGKISLSPILSTASPPQRIVLTLEFSSAEGELRATLNGAPVQIEPAEASAEEDVYL